MPGFQRITQRRTAARGYGTPHQRERARHQPAVDAGRGYCAQPICLKPSRWIQPGTRWALGHNDERTAWIGPVHELCNQRAAARKGARLAAAGRRRRRQQRAPVW